MPTDPNPAAESAKALVQRGDLPGAILAYTRLFEQNPGDWSLGNTLGDLYLRQGKLDAAVSIFIRLADRLASDGRAAEARQLYRKVLVFQPSNTTLRQRVAELETQPISRADVSQQRVTETSHVSAEPAPETPVTPEPPVGPVAFHPEPPVQECVALVTTEPRREELVAWAPPDERLAPAIVLAAPPAASAAADHGESVDEGAAATLAPAPALPAAGAGSSDPRRLELPIFDGPVESDDEWLAVDALATAAHAVPVVALSRSLSLAEPRAADPDGAIASADSGDVSAERPGSTDAGAAVECAVPPVGTQETPIAVGPDRRPETDVVVASTQPVAVDAHDELEAREGDLCPVEDQIEPRPDDARSGVEAVHASVDEPAAETAGADAGGLVGDAGGLWQTAPDSSVPQERVPPVAPATAPVADTLWEWKDLAEAFEHTRRTRLERAAAAAEERLIESSDLIESAKFDDAVRLLETAACAPHLRCAASCRLADVLLKQGAPLEALACLEWAARIPPPTKESGYELAYCLALTFEALGERSQALGIYRELAADAGPSYRDVVSRSERLAAI